jgi:hypothetical protein
MADLVANAPIRLMPGAKIVSQRFVLDTSTAQTIYKGQPMIIDQSVDTLNVRGYVDATVVDPTDVFVGIAAESKSVALGDPETTEIEVYVGPTIVGLKSAVYTEADLGKTVYMSDSSTLSATAADNPQTGKLNRVLDGYAYTELTAPQICAGA